MDKSTQHFQDTIKEYLDKRAEEDALFAEKYRNTTRTIEDVCTYIINQVKQAGVCGWSDDEIFSMAVHCIDEPDMDIGKPTQCRVVINRQVQLTEEEIAEAKKKAMENLIREQENKLRKPTTPKKPTEKPQAVQTSLFDF